MAGDSFYKFSCTNSDYPQCATCPKTFIIPDGVIEGVFKDKDGKALILIRKVHYLPDPHCGNPDVGALTRFIRTNEDFDTFITGKMPGRVIDAGSCTLVDLDYAPKG